MGWTLKYNTSQHIVVLTYEGHLELRDFVEASFAKIKEAKTRGTHNFLVDCSLLLVDANRTELFDLPSRLYAKWGMDPSSRITLIEPRNSEDKAKAEFYVFATQNLGWLAKMFNNRKKALEWLNEE